MLNFYVYFFLHCPLSGPVLIYISLLIISCIIEYVTNKRTLNLKTPRLINRKSSAKLSVSVARNGTIAACAKQNKKVTLAVHQLKMPCLSETWRLD